jgi:hypothetical protein
MSDEWKTMAQKYADLQAENERLKRDNAAMKAILDLADALRNRELKGKAA